MSREKWETPELTVFVKGAPEDNILTHCKSSHNPTYQNTASTGNHCQAATQGELEPGNCGACQSNGGGLS